MRRDKKKKLARTFTIVTAVLLLLLFILRDVVRENLKDVHDSLTQAEARFRAYAPQSHVVRRSQERAFGKIVGPKAGRDVTPPLVISIRDALQQAWDDYDSVSGLIDALPSGATDLRKLRNLTHYEEWVTGFIRDPLLYIYKTADLRKLRDKFGTDLDQAQKQLDEQQARHPEDLATQQATQLSAMEKALDIEDKLSMLGDLALVSARHEREAMERQIRMYSYDIYALGFLVLVLGIYAAIAGLKSEGNEG